ncbi:MAG TPA: AI-2E family transporter [Thermoleophilia bacterium]|nr:AI-2E family transporter [Thermoleophilia bacterium]
MKSGSHTDSSERGSPDTLADDARLMADEKGLTAGTRLALTAACAVVVIIGMRITATVIAPVILAFVVTVAIAPVLGWFMRRGLSRMSAYALTLTITLLSAVFIIVLLGASLASFALGLPDYADEIQPYWDWAVRFFDRLGIDLNSLFSLKDLDPKSLVEAGVTLVGSLTNLLSVLALMGFVFAFMLLDATTISRKLEAGMMGRGLGAAVRLTTELRAFVKVTAYLGAAVAILETILLLVLGVPNALLWGLLSFFLSFIPYIGFILALIPPALLALITGGWVAALVVVGGYVGINTVSDNMIKPHMMGTETNLSPLTVFVSLVLWGWVLGPLGGLLAVPMTLIVKDLFFEVYPEWRGLALLLGNPPEEAAASGGKGQPGPAAGAAGSGAAHAVAAANSARPEEAS